MSTTGNLINMDPLFPLDNTSELNSSVDDFIQNMYLASSQELLGQNETLNQKRKASIDGSDDEVGELLTIKCIYT